MNKEPFEARRIRRYLNFVAYSFTKKHYQENFIDGSMVYVLKGIQAVEEYNNGLGKVLLDALHKKEAKGWISPPDETS